LRALVSVLQGCDTATLVELVQDFSKNGSPSSRVETFKNIKELQLFEKPGTAEPVTLFHSTDELDLLPSSHRPRTL
jgi:hypothetical protein